MPISIHLFILLFLAITSSVHAAELVAWSSTEGVRRLERSQAKEDFSLLANHFESQENKVFCGVASAVMVLNALRLENSAIGKPQDQTVLSKEERRYLPARFDPVFERYTQQNVLTKKAKTRMEILGKPIQINGKTLSDYGLQLHQLADVLKAHNLDVKVRVVDASLPDERIRRELIENMQTARDYVLVNYLRKNLGQGKEGHISPLGAYDEMSDSFLIMDVNPNKSQWVWVKATDLIAAMRTFDVVENRGYVVVREGDKVQ